MSTSTVEAPTADDVPRIVGDLSRTSADVRGVVVFGRDGVLRVFAPPLSLQEAERWSALLNQIASLARGAGRLLARGGLDSTLLRVSARQAALLQPVNDAFDIGVVVEVEGGAHLAQIAHSTATAAARLSSVLPGRVSRSIGAPVQAAA
ncbi:roadblock/LC7 domain-containing protein [Nocardiopsis sp. LOL_012]|uniref:roadblock/LC7 domain-containing protein n=1 Tax=Nocardiopsis sp. LOL_012 TaxID=3345409 RepID=UPI003A87AB57